MSLVCLDPATDHRFDRRFPQVIEWRGETYTNNRDQVEFIHLWNQFFNRHAPRALSDIFGEIYGHRPAGERERNDARQALRNLRHQYYVR